MSTRAFELARGLDDLWHETVLKTQKCNPTIDEAAAELRRLDAEVESLRHALSFYADETRYRGPNQSLDAPDYWSEKVGLNAYLLDVTRDRGVIARNALENPHG
jgi:hypothetical protein